jgi:hypothetical protein
MAVAKAFEGPLFAFLTVTGVNGVRCDLQVRVLVDGAVSPKSALVSGTDDLR